MATVYTKKFLLLEAVYCFLLQTWEELLLKYISVSSFIVREQS